MESDDVVELAAGQVADREAVDWHALAQRARTDEERAQLRLLQVIRKIADLHRSTALPATAAPLLPSAAPEDSPAMPARAWGHYQLLEKVGSGTFGTVYRAWDSLLEREIAIKILHHGDDLAEAQTLAKVQDPNVVTVFGSELHHGRRGLCMEFVHGETLEDRLRAHGTVTAQEAVLVGQDVCRALIAVHRSGIIHRDVKATNVMRRSDGRILLMDFGTGRHINLLDRPTGPGNVVGTALFMAPEVLAEQPASPRSDVYSVGVLLYRLVTGKYPVEGRTLDDIRASHMFGKRVPATAHRPDLPAAFLEVLDCALAPDPQKRCASAGELLEMLAPIGLRAAPEARSRARDAARTAAGVALVLALITALGALNSRYFNTSLARTEFVHETLWDAFVWGFRSLVAPAVLSMVAVLALSVLIVCRRLLLGASAHARRLEQALKAVVRRYQLDDVGTLSACVLMAATAVLVGAWFSFRPLIDALIIYPDVSTVPARDLALLGPRFQPVHEAYRAWFIWVTIFCVLVWYPPLRLAAKRREPLNRALLSGGGVVALLAVLMLDFPYRLLYGHNAFEAAQWKGTRCYILGERGEDVLLFCPLLDPPRNRIVSRRSSELERLGINESLFTPFSAE